MSGMVPFLYKGSFLKGGEHRKSNQINHSSAQKPDLGREVEQQTLIGSATSSRGGYLLIDRFNTTRRRPRELYERRQSTESSKSALQVAVDTQSLNSITTSSNVVEICHACLQRTMVSKRRRVMTKEASIQVEEVVHAQQVVESTNLPLPILNPLFQTEKTDIQLNSDQPPRPHLSNAKVSSLLKKANGKDVAISAESFAKGKKVLEAKMQYLTADPCYFNSATKRLHNEDLNEINSKENLHVNKRHYVEKENKHLENKNVKASRLLKKANGSDVLISRSAIADAQKMLAKGGTIDSTNRNMEERRDNYSATITNNTGYAKSEKGTVNGPIPDLAVFNSNSANANILSKDSNQVRPQDMNNPKPMKTSSLFQTAKGGSISISASALQRANEIFDSEEPSLTKSIASSSNPTLAPHSSAKTNRTYSTVQQFPNDSSKVEINRITTHLTGSKLQSVHQPSRSEVTRPTSLMSPPSINIISANFDRSSLLKNEPVYVQDPVQSRLLSLRKLTSQTCLKCSFEPCGVCLLDSTSSSVSKWSELMSVARDLANKYKVNVAWVNMQLRWVCWTLVSYERRYPNLYLGNMFSHPHICMAMENRCKVYSSTRHKAAGIRRSTGRRQSTNSREFFSKFGTMSPLQRCEDILCFAWPLCVCLAVEREFATWLSNAQVGRILRIWGTDGWWWTQLKLDAYLINLVEKGCLNDGEKVVIFAGSFQSSENEGRGILSVQSNGMRRCRDDAKLGYVDPTFLRRGLAIYSLREDGGPIFAIRIRIVEALSPMIRFRLRREESSESFITIDDQLLRSFFGYLEEMFVEMTQSQDARDAYKLIQDDAQEFRDYLVCCPHSTAKNKESLAWLRLPYSSRAAEECPDMIVSVRPGDEVLVSNFRIFSTVSSMKLIRFNDSSSLRVIRYDDTSDTNYFDLSDWRQRLSNQPSAKAFISSRVAQIHCNLRNNLMDEGSDQEIRNVEITTSLFIIDWTISAAGRCRIGEVVLLTVRALTLDRMCVEINIPMFQFLISKLLWLKKGMNIMLFNGIVQEIDSQLDMIRLRKSDHSFIRSLDVNNQKQVPVEKTQFSALDLSDILSDERSRWEALTCSLFYFQSLQYSQRSISCSRQLQANAHICTLDGSKNQSFSLLSFQTPQLCTLQYAWAAKDLPKVCTVLPTGSVYNMSVSQLQCIETVEIESSKIDVGWVVVWIW